MGRAKQLNLTAPRRRRPLANANASSCSTSMQASFCATVELCRSFDHACCKDIQNTYKVGAHCHMSMPARTRKSLDQTGRRVEVLFSLTCASRRIAWNLTAPCGVLQFKQVAKHAAALRTAVECDGGITLQLNVTGLVLGALFAIRLHSRCPSGEAD